MHALPPILFLLKLFLATHVWTESFRYSYGTICLKVVLKECNKHSRGGVMVLNPNNLIF